MYDCFMKFLLIASLFLISACSASSQNGASYKISNSSALVEHQIQVNSFLLTSYERITSKGGVANIYIEGDGRAWLSKKRPSLDPTPNNPVALKLAAQDPAENVVYLARPCQYTKLIEQGACPQKYWTSHRFTPEVIEAMNSALDDMKQRHQITGFNLIGFSGGGNIAALLTALRDDVLSLRTVAGNIDHKLQSSIHGVSTMPHSLNAAEVSNQISDIPQIHFVGTEDKIVPNEVAQSYKARANNNECIQIRLLQGLSHTKGWESVWKSLLNQPFDCEAQ